MKIEPLTVHIGAQIKEVDLAELDEAALAEIKQRFGSIRFWCSETRPCREMLI
jgi:hypothetical protein